MCNDLSNIKINHTGKMGHLMSPNVRGVCQFKINILDTFRNVVGRILECGELRRRRVKEQ